MTLVPVALARRFVLAGCAPLPPRATNVRDAVGLVLAEAVWSNQDVPPFANSAVDGYAVRAKDTAGAPVRLRVVATVMAGDTSAALVGDQDAVRIMTGAPMPPGADAVCMLEGSRAEAGGTAVIVDERVLSGTNVRLAGEDISAGTAVFGPGTPLTPPHIGVLASLGTETVLVRPVPRVGVVSTGDELASPLGVLGAGKIHDANGPALLARLRADGFEAVDLGMVGDDEGALARVLQGSAPTCDVVVATGGVSAGDRDVVKIVMEDLCAPGMRSMQVAVKPARPFAFGTLLAGRAPVFGLPGNPVAALVSYELFVRPALRAMAGHEVLDRPFVLATAEADLVRHRDGKLHLVGVMARAGPEGTLLVRPAGRQGAHMLRAMADADALALLPDGDGVPPGGRVEVLLLRTDCLGLLPADCLGLLPADCLGLLPAERLGFSGGEADGDGDGARFSSAS
jgi:molybdenum cofactor synthesis domain-containing protein